MKYAHDVDLFAIKSLDSIGNGDVSDIAKGVKWVIRNNMHVQNMSFDTKTDSQRLHDIIVSSSNSEITMVVAAGNNYGGSCECLTAYYSEVVLVSAINQEGSILSFSVRQCADAYASEVDIYSTYLGNGYVELDGTPMVCSYELEILDKV